MPFVFLLCLSNASRASALLTRRADAPRRAAGWDGSSTVAAQEGGALSRPWRGCVHTGSAQFVNDQGAITLDDVWPTGLPGDERRSADERLGRAVARYVLGIPRCNAALIQARFQERDEVPFLLPALSVAFDRSTVRTCCAGMRRRLASRVFNPAALRQVAEGAEQPLVLFPTPFPPLQVRPSGVVAVATRDILPGEEILTSYAGSRWWLERLRHALYVQARSLRAEEQQRPAKSPSHPHSSLPAVLRRMHVNSLPCFRRAPPRPAPPRRSAGALLLGGRSGSCRRRGASRAGGEADRRPREGVLHHGVGARVRLRAGEQGVPSAGAGVVRGGGGASQGAAGSGPVPERPPPSAAARAPLLMPHACVRRCAAPAHSSWGAG